MPLTQAGPICERQGCGKPRSERPNALYCSATCRKYAYADRERERHAAALLLLAEMREILTAR